MFKLFPGAAPVPVRTEPTALLKLVAGEFAADVARIWPEPHTDFLTAATARRHLVCLALALDNDVAIVAGAVLRGRLREAIGATLARSPPGLERALGRLGETAWTAVAYRKLAALLADPRRPSCCGTPRPSTARRWPGWRGCLGPWGGRCRSRC